MKINKFIPISFLALLMSVLILMALASCSEATDPTAAANTLSLSTVAGAQADGTLTLPDTSR